jgi:hopanoid biosynthesis associated radical SAM protein HpnH
VATPVRLKAPPPIATAEEALRLFRPERPVRPRRPAGMGVRLFTYILAQRLKGRKRFPLVTMLEPLEACNLTCEGCGRIREYEPVLHRMLTLEECLRAVEAAGAPIVSIAGGEPTIYPPLPHLLTELVRRKYYVFCCTNGLLLEKLLEKVPPSPYLCWVIHLDGMEELHDFFVARRGVWRTAMRAAKRALERGYRVCSNTTIFKGSRAEDLYELFETVTQMGFEGIMLSAGYDFQAVPNQDVFLKRRESIEVFRNLLAPERLRRYRFYNNPLYLAFLRGERSYQCTAWSNPTYTILGWRKPCYLLADTHASDVRELFSDDLWERYGVGKDPRCANCMMHCGFESATIFGALRRPGDMARMVLGILQNRSGLGAS